MCKLLEAPKPIVDTFKDSAWDRHTTVFHLREIPPLCGDDTALKEAHRHFVLAQFEELLHQHGLSNLLKDMSDDSAFELLKQASVINNAT